MTSPSPTRTLGVTGGIGSGKTTVCRLFEALGARVFYADMEGKRILAEDDDARAEVVARFGADVYRPDGTLDRAALARRVFADDDELAALNRIVHSRVREAFFDARRRAEVDGVRLLVEEAALIYESGADRFLDAVAVVDAPLDVRIARVTARDGVSREAVEARMRHQLPAEELRRRADFVIENDGPLEALRPQVERVYAAVVGTPPDPVTKYE